MIYFDHNATTPVRPEVLEAMMPHLGGLAGNPSSLHAAGRRARSDVDSAREQVAAALGCAPGEVCFTSGGTESDNWAIKGVVSAAAAGSRRRRIVTSSIEHHAVWHACEHLQELGIEVAYAPVDAAGTVLPEAVAELIDDATLLVSVMHANNETGRLQPVAEIAAAARERGSLFHCDAVQSFGKLPWRGTDLGADLVSVSAHKINGPKGVGALYVRPGTPLHPLAHGGGHEGGLRAGTENVAGIVGFGAAAALALEELQGPGETPARRVGRLRDQLEAGILASLDAVEINGRSAGASAAGGDPGPPARHLQRRLPRRRGGGGNSRPRPRGNRGCQRLGLHLRSPRALARPARHGAGAAPRLLVGALQPGMGEHRGGGGALSSSCSPGSSDACASCRPSRLPSVPSQNHVAMGRGSRPARGRCRIPLRRLKPRLNVVPSDSSWRRILSTSPSIT